MRLIEYTRGTTAPSACGSSARCIGWGRYIDTVLFSCGLYCTSAVLKGRVQSRDGRVSGPLPGLSRRLRVSRDTGPPARTPRGDAPGARSDERTNTHQIIDVKHQQARVVLRSGTTREGRVAMVAHSFCPFFCSPPPPENAHAPECARRHLACPGGAACGVRAHDRETEHQPRSQVNSPGAEPTWDAASRTQHASPQHLHQRQPHERSVADTLIATSSPRPRCSRRACPASTPPRPLGRLAAPRRRALECATTSTMRRSRKQPNHTLEPSRITAAARACPSYLLSTPRAQQQQQGTASAQARAQGHTAATH